jgi:hypothetical protein
VRAVPLRRSLALLAILCTLGFTLEFGARFAVPRISRIEKRVVKEYQAALAAPQPGRRMILVLGNSLLEAGVNFDRLRAGLGPSFDTRRWMVEQTSYWDWLFGLRRLLAEGARPNVVVLLLERHQVVTDEYRGDYFAHRMMLASDLTSVASSLRLHPTVAAGMFTARASAFWGLRTELRKVLLGRLMPDLPILMGRLLITPGAQFSPEYLASKGRGRLVNLRDTAAAGHARFVFVMIPGPEATARYAAKLKAAVTSDHVDMIMPLHDGQLGRSDFRDGFHMNEAGAAKYTDALIRELRAVLDTPSAEESYDGH